MSQLHTFCSLLFCICTLNIVYCQPGASATIIFEEDWEDAVADNVPTGWSGDIDQATTLDTAWVVGMGPSSMADTGPNSANTGSQYLFFASGSPAGPGEMAELISPSINITGNNPTLNFALYMYGAEIEMLDVSVVSGGSKTLLQRYSTQIQSSKTEAWSIQDLDLSAYVGQSIQLSFEAQKMNLSTGDIALDSIFIYYLPSTTTPIPTLGQWAIMLLSIMLIIIITVTLKPVLSPSHNR